MIFKGLNIYSKEKVKNYYKNNPEKSLKNSETEFERTVTELNEKYRYQKVSDKLDSLIQELSNEFGQDSVLEDMSYNMKKRLIDNV